MEFVNRKLQYRHRALCRSGAYEPSALRGRVLLASQSGDALAQVLSFLPLWPCRAVAVVSKKARVYATVANSAFFTTATRPAIELSHEVLRHVVAGSKTSEHDPARMVEVTAWWLAQCALPAEANGFAALQAVLDGPPEVVARLDAIVLAEDDTAVLHVLQPLLLQLEVLHAHEKHGTLSAAVPSAMTNLRVRSIESCSQATLQLIQLVPSLTALHIASAKVSSLDLSRFACAAHLVTLNAFHSDITHLLGLDHCVSLAHVDVSRCGQLRSVEALAEAPSIRTLKANGSGVDSVCGMRAWPCLEVVDVSNCGALVSLEPLPTAQSRARGHRGHHWRISGAAAHAVRVVLRLNSCSARENPSGKKAHWAAR